MSSFSLGVFGKSKDRKPPKRDEDSDNPDSQGPTTPRTFLEHVSRMIVLEYGADMGEMGVNSFRGYMFGGNMIPMHTKNLAIDVLLETASKLRPNATKAGENVVKALVSVADNDRMVEMALERCVEISCCRRSALEALGRRLEAALDLVELEEDSILKVAASGRVEDALSALAVASELMREESAMRMVEWAVLDVRLWETAADILFRGPFTMHKASLLRLVRETSHWVRVFAVEAPCLEGNWDPDEKDCEAVLEILEGEDDEVAEKRRRKREGKGFGRLVLGDGTMERILDVRTKGDWVEGSDMARALVQLWPTERARKKGDDMLRKADAVGNNSNKAKRLALRGRMRFAWKGTLRVPKYSAVRRVLDVDDLVVEISEYLLPLSYELDVPVGLATGCHLLCGGVDRARHAPRGLMGHRSRLGWAAYGNDADLIRRFLEDGDAVEGKEEEETTPLMCAAAAGGKEAVEVLLGAGASVTAKSAKGCTALLCASIGTDNVDVARLLLDAGSDVNSQRTSNKYTPLVYAARQPSADLVELLLARGANVNSETDANNTALMLAAEKGCDRCVELLLAAGANVHTVNSKYGNNAVLLAASAAGKSPRCVELLLAAGGDPFQVNRKGITSLMYAAREQSPEAMHMFLNAGVPMDATSNENKTAFSYTIEKQSIPCLRILLQAHVPVPTPALLNSALVLCLTHGEHALVADLLHVGADPNYSHHGRHALILAVESNSELCLRRLLEVGSGTEAVRNAAALAAAKLHDEPNLLRVLFSYAVNPLLTDPSSNDTLLHVAVRYKNPRLAQFLLQLQPDLAEAVNVLGAKPGTIK